MQQHSHGASEHQHGAAEHVHDHAHASDDATDSPVLDLSVPDAELSPSDLGRRGFLRRAGLLGATAAAGSALATAAPAAATERRGGAKGDSSQQYQWLAGDHHIHTQYSPDAMYRVVDQVQHAAAFGLDWMVITDHGTVQHAKIGVEKVNPDIVKARSQFKDAMLVFQGLEWNIPAAEHGTVFVHPGKNEVTVLKEFENGFDGSVRGTSASSPANELEALKGLDFLAASISSGRVKDAMFFANHPSRRGVDSPHEIRGWRERQPEVALGMEGAPGHQAAGIPTRQLGPGSGRGFYDNAPSSNSFAGYPPESYVTYGGFDWMTSTVGGLWDSLLAEGTPWWITSNSDAHNIWLDEATRGPGSDFANNGFYNDPVHGTAGPVTTNGDFWPGFYSRTHVGAERYSYAAVMDALRAGRVWVDHGGLIDGLDMSVRRRGARGPGSPIGSVVTPRKGDRLELVAVIDQATLPNWAQFVPQLARVDVIKGSVTGPATDKDSIVAPTAKVVLQQDVSGTTGRVVITYDLGRVDQPFYVRVRGTDGNRSAVGLRGPKVDPVGPAVDVKGDADPWVDLWFYTNPIWVVPGR